MTDLSALFNSPLLGLNMFLIGLRQQSVVGLHRFRDLGSLNSRKGAGF